MKKLNEDLVKIGETEIDLSRSNYRSGVSHGEPEFKSKIAESIWRLKKNK